MARIAESFRSAANGLPAAADQGMLERGFESWASRSKRAGDGVADAAAALADDSAGRAVLSAVFGNSPFLTRLLTNDPEFAIDLLSLGPDEVFARELHELEPLRQSQNRAEVMAGLRKARARAALSIAVADIAEIWDLSQVTNSISDFAQAAVSTATAHLLGELHRREEIVLPDPDNPEFRSGYVVLGMGKLGARELNYSSDIDLIVLYDPHRIEYIGRKSVQEAMVRLTRDLVHLMQEQTSDGYVFRTDLRLRPDPGSTPPAISVQAAEIYYESTGQNWERAAMIKARPIAGDMAVGQAFLEVLAPFMWRKNLDFAAIRDIDSIKRQIHAHRGHASVRVEGHNVKLGRGGIREVEFFAQTQQLIWGGRDPNLRQITTFGALDALVEAGHVKAETAERLKRSYSFLRRVEHRLQMVDDRQIHELPDDPEGVERIATFLGYDSRNTFADELVDVLESVAVEYDDSFDDGGDLAAPGNLVFTGADDDPDTMKTLAEMGFRDPAAISDRIRTWHRGRYRATRSTRAKELLTDLVPSLLQAFSHSIEPDAALMRFDAFLRELPAGVQLFSLFHANPQLFETVSDIMGTAPRLADWLSKHPILLDGVITQGFFEDMPDAGALAAELDEALEHARDFQDVLDILRRWNSDHMFQTGVHMLRASVDAEQACGPLSDVADVSLRALLPRVEDEFSGNHGRFAEGGMAVIGFGKLGSCEMTIGSDLDLLFLYDTADGTAESDGPKGLSPGPYFARLSQRLINAITAPTAEGILYEVDMRLRPAGNAGPIATSLDAFRKYHAEDAWTWEHMALTRARVIAGPPALADRATAAIREALTQPRDAEKTLKDVAEMRRRIDQEHGTTDIWRVKHHRGGLMDVEFIAQYLQLCHAADAPDVLSPNTATAIGRLADAGFLDTLHARVLVDALHLWRQVQALIRMSSGEGFNAATAPAGLRRLLARGTGAEDFETLTRAIETTQDQVLEIFKNVVEEPAAALAGND